MREEIKILRPNPIKTIAFLIVGALFVVIGFYLMEENPFMAWIAIIFFGSGVIVFAIQLMPDSSILKLSNDGFEVKNLFKSDFTKWSDVNQFRVGYAGQTKMVMFDFSRDHKKHNVGKKVAKFLSGNEGALPETYGMKAKDLSELMNDWKSKNENVAQQQAV